MSLYVDVDRLLEYFPECGFFCQVYAVDFPDKRDEKKKQKAEFENFLQRFQRWSDKEGQNGCDPAGCCGCGYICEWCEDSADKNPCAKALRRCLKENDAFVNVKEKNPDYYNSVFFGNW